MEDRRAQENRANIPRGETDPGSRMAGKENKGLLLPPQDSNTEDRRQHDGETPKFFGCVNFKGPESFDVNNTKTPNNPTRDDRINGTMFKHMCQ